MGNILSLDNRRHQVSLTYILGYEAIRHVNIKSVADVHDAIQSSEDQLSTLITAFKMRLGDLQKGVISVADVAAWCDALANTGNNTLSKKEYDYLLPTIDELHPYLRLKGHPSRKIASSAKRLGGGNSSPTLLMES